MVLLKSVALYLKVLWAQWKVLLTGGSTMAIVAIWALATNRALPYNVGWLILGVTFVVASFLAWRREYEQARAVHITPSPRDERQTLITTWRAMVTDTHKKMRAAPFQRAPVAASVELPPKPQPKSVTELLEGHPDFPSIRPYLSQQSKDALWGRKCAVAPDQFTMHGTLHSILQDIDRMEQKWGVR